MRTAYLEVTYQRGRPLAGYLYLPREEQPRSHRTEDLGAGLLVDFDAEGRAMGIEITAPRHVTIGDLNRALAHLGLAPMTSSDLAPLCVA